MRTALSILLCVSACAGNGDRSKDPDEKPPSPYVVDEATSPEPSAAVSELEDGLQAGIDAVMLLGAPPVRDAYLAAMQGASANCPSAFSGPDGDYWFDDCTSPSGSKFSGYVFDYASYDIVDPYSGVVYDSWYVYGGATIETNSGQRMDLGGVASMTEVDYGVVQSWQSVVQGTFTWDGPEAGGTWLERDLDPDLISVFQIYPSYNARVAYIDGGVGGLGPSRQWAVAFDEATVFDAILGSACQAEPRGAISVRAADGSWYDLRFHGSDEYGNTSGPCDGCGDAFYQGEELGLVCGDFSAWLGWGGAPW